MNEEELKQIWNKDKAAVAPAIDFEAMKKNMRGWEGKLRRKIKIDIMTNAAAYVLLIPAVIYYPAILYLAPLMILVWVWYLWETLRIYRQETNSTESGSTKEYLETKKRFLENYISRTRYIVYILTPISALGGIYMSGFSPKIWQSLLLLAAILIFVEILLAIVVEIYVRKVYVPSVNELKELLKQLD
jgi:hypothetical protein